MPTLTEIIIGCAMKVHRTFGPGFLEKIYEHALLHELRKAGLYVEQQVPYSVMYDGVNVGNYIADLVVERKVVVELKAQNSSIEPYTGICINYLKASNLSVILLINFGKPSLEWKRFVGANYDANRELL